MELITTQVWPVVLDWLVVHGPRVVGILVGAWIASRVAHKLIDRLIRRVIPRGQGSQVAEEMRENTLILVFGGTFSVMLWLVAGLMLLSEFGVAIGPLLAAAGIVGVAVGFGGQYLIRDLIAGLFFLIENQFRVGDVVCLDDTCGLVEHVTLRMTTLRDLDGVVHHVPNGAVNKIANMSKDFARVNLDIGVSYSANLAQVEKVINQVGAELAQDPEWAKRIVSPPKFLRVNEFADSAVVVKVLGDTKPLKQWEVAGELRKRLKIAFDQAGIEIPFPQRVIHQGK